MGNKKIFSGTQWKEIERKLAKGKKKIRDIKAYNRLLALRMRGLGKSNKEIGETLGFHPNYITTLVNKYLKEGMDAILSDGRTSNNRRMSFEEETEFLKQFKETAESGQIITIHDILAKFNETSGKTNDDSTIYRLLKRHGWRKIKPRPHHPNKASEAEIEASKKLTKITGRSYWKNIEEINETRTSSTKTSD